ncbi:MAG: bile acid:sodium symporter family protein [Desulfomonilaceae bacterium]
MGLNDLILLVVIFGSAFLAVVFPDLWVIFQPYPVYIMMFLLFLSFMKIDFGVLLDTSPTAMLGLGKLVLIKLIILPVALYWLCLWIIPDYAVPVLLVSGISTGVVAPFMATLVNAEVSQVARMTVITSILVPLSLPGLVKLLVGADISIPFGLMVRMLALVIFIPIIAVLFMRRFLPGVLHAIDGQRFPLSLVAFATINFGVFSQYSSFFYQNAGQILVAVALAHVLSVIYYVTGFVVTPKEKQADRLAAGVSLAMVNNILVIVFSSGFFGPLCPTLAAMYVFPFFTMIIPVKLVLNYTGLLSTPKRCDGDIE